MSYIVTTQQYRMSSIQEKKIELLIHGYCRLNSKRKLYFVIKNRIYEYTRDIDWFIEDASLYKKYFNGFIQSNFKQHHNYQFFWRLKIMTIYMTPQFEIGICNGITSGDSDTRIHGYYFKPFKGIKGEWRSNDCGETRYDINRKEKYPIKFKEKKYQIKKYEPLFAHINFKKYDIINIHLSYNNKQITLTYGINDKFFNTAFVFYNRDIRGIVSKWRIYTTKDAIEIDSFNIKTDLLTFYKH